MRKTTRLQFQRATDPGQTPPELDALGLSLVQDCMGIQVYCLSGSYEVAEGSGFYQVDEKLHLSVEGDRMWISPHWLPHTVFGAYDPSIIKEYVLKTHDVYKYYTFPPIREMSPAEEIIIALTTRQGGKKKSPRLSVTETGP